MLGALLSLARNAVTRLVGAGDAGSRACHMFARNVVSKDLEGALIWGMLW